MAIRNFSNAPATSLNLGCSPTDTIIHCESDPGFPQAPFELVLDYGQSNEELVLCTAKSNADFTVTRGFDGTTAYSHDLGAAVYHGIGAIDPREANLHVNATHDVHGVVGDLVGADQEQTLTNKTLQSPTITSATIHSPTIDNAILTNDVIVQPDPNSQTIPLEIQNEAGVQVGSIARSGTLTAPQFVSGKGNDWAGYIAYVDSTQVASGFAVRKNDDTVLAGFDANGNVFAQNLAPGNAVIAPYWYGSKADADHLTTNVWEKLESFSVDQHVGSWDYTNGFLTVPSGGRYRVTATAGFGAGSSVGSRGIRIMVTPTSGADIEFARMYVPTGTTTSCALTVAVSKPIPAGYKVYVQLFQNSGGTLDGGGSVNGPCLMQVEWIGPTS